MQADIKVLSLDREAFPYSNGLPGVTLHDVSFTSHVLLLRCLLPFSYSLPSRNTSICISILQIVKLKITPGMFLRNGRSRYHYINQCALIWKSTFSFNNYTRIRYLHSSWETWHCSQEWTGPFGSMQNLVQFKPVDPIFIYFLF